MLYDPQNRKEYLQLNSNYPEIRNKSMFDKLKENKPNNTVLGLHLTNNASLCKVAYELAIQAERDAETIRKLSSTVASMIKQQNEEDRMLIYRSIEIDKVKRQKREWQNRATLAEKLNLELTKETSEMDETCLELN